MAWHRVYIYRIMGLLVACLCGGAPWGHAVNPPPLSQGIFECRNTRSIQDAGPSSGDQEGVIPHDPHLYHQITPDTLDSLVWRTDWDASTHNEAFTLFNAIVDANDKGACMALQGMDPELCTLAIITLKAKSDGGKKVGASSQNLPKDIIHGALTRLSETLDNAGPYKKMKTLQLYMLANHRGILGTMGSPLTLDKMLSILGLPERSPSPAPSISSEKEGEEEEEEGESSHHEQPEPAAQEAELETPQETELESEDQDTTIEEESPPAPRADPFVAINALAMALYYDVSPEIYTPHAQRAIKDGFPYVNYDRLIYRWLFQDKPKPTKENLDIKYLRQFQSFLKGIEDAPQFRAPSQVHTAWKSWLWWGYKVTPEGRGDYYQTTIELAEGGYPDAQYEAAVTALQKYASLVGDDSESARTTRQQTKETALAYLRKAMDQDHSGAAYELAMLYRSHSSEQQLGGIGPDARLYEKYLRKAAVNGHITAFSLLSPLLKSHIEALDRDIGNIKDFDAPQTQTPSPQEEEVVDAFEASTSGASSSQDISSSIAFISEKIVDQIIEEAFSMILPSHAVHALSVHLESKILPSSIRKEILHTQRDVAPLEALLHLRAQEVAFFEDTMERLLLSTQKPPASIVLEYAYLGIYLARGKETHLLERALPSLKELGQKKNSAALELLATIYEEGLAGEADKHRAWEYFKRVYDATRSKTSAEGMSRLKEYAHDVGSEASYASSSEQDVASTREEGPSSQDLSAFL